MGKDLIISVEQVNLACVNEFCIEKIYTNPWQNGKLFVPLHPQCRDVLPAKVHLAVLNWECEWKSPTVPQQWTPLWLLSINAIELRSMTFTLYKVRMYSALFLLNQAIGLLPEKALGSGGKSEVQPFSVICQTALDVRAWGESNIFVGLWNMNQSSSCTTVVRLLLKR